MDPYLLFLLCFLITFLGLALWLWLCFRFIFIFFRRWVVWWWFRSLFLSLFTIFGYFLLVLLLLGFLWVKCYTIRYGELQKVTPSLEESSLSSSGSESLELLESSWFNFFTPFNLPPFLVFFTCLTSTKNKL